MTPDIEITHTIGGAYVIRHDTGTTEGPFTDQQLADKFRDEGDQS